MTPLPFPPTVRETTYCADFYQPSQQATYRNLQSIVWINMRHAEAYLNVGDGL